jgi:hypothetical protein
MKRKQLIRYLRSQGCEMLKKKEVAILGGLTPD